MFRLPRSHLLLFVDLLAVSPLVISSTGQYCSLFEQDLTLMLFSRGGNVARLQYFLIVSTCFLYLVAAGLFSKGVWALEINSWNKIVGGDAAEVGSGPGSYDIRKSVWHVNVSLLPYHSIHFSLLTHHL